MVVSHSIRSLILTLVICISFILIVSNVYIPKKDLRSAETFFEIIGEEIIQADNKEAPSQLLETADLVHTNRAYNEFKNDQPDEGKHFEELLEKIRSRSERGSINTIQKVEPAITDLIEAEQINEFKAINALIKQHPNEAPTESSSSVRYFLKDRTKIHIPVPVYLCEEGGKIVINIVVNSEGQVIQTSYNNSSTSNHGCLIDCALKYAKASIFETVPTKKTQLGTITFLFKGKQ
jgi:hypothetical protein